MRLINFWEYVIDNGWQIAPMPEDKDGNHVCPFCDTTIKRKVELDKVPEYDMKYLALIMSITMVTIACCRRG